MLEESKPTAICYDLLLMFLFLKKENNSAAGRHGMLLSYVPCQTPPIITEGLADFYNCEF